VSNEEKTNDYENFEKGMILYENFEKRGGSREKGGGGNEIHSPCAWVWHGYKLSFRITHFVPFSLLPPLFSKFSYKIIPFSKFS
jgi:hypothetical protein